MKNDRFKFCVWDIQNNCYLRTKQGLFFKLKDGGLRSVAWFIMRPEQYIVEQCTGLRDKNGKLVFERDVITSKFNGLGAIIYNHSALVVVWKNEVCFYGHKTTSTPIPLDTHNIEIIGNIHENPQLLKV